MLLGLVYISNNEAINKVITKKMSGSCLCGSIVYEALKIGEKMAHCHCSMCRKFHGAAFATFGEVKSNDFRWLKGEELLSSYTANNGTTRKFCKVCGSSLVFQPSNDDGKLVEFALGTLDCQIAQKPDAHIYTAFKANWYEIADNIIQYENGRECGNAT